MTCRLIHLCLLSDAAVWLLVPLLVESPSPPLDLPYDEPVLLPVLIPLGYSPPQPASSCMLPFPGIPSYLSSCQPDLSPFCFPPPLPKPELGAPFEDFDDRPPFCCCRCCWNCNCHWFCHGWCSCCHSSSGQLNSQSRCCSPISPL